MLRGHQDEGSRNSGPGAVPGRRWARGPRVMSDRAIQWSEVPWIYQEGSQWPLHFGVTKEPKSACGTLKENRVWVGVEEGGTWEREGGNER